VPTTAENEIVYLDSRELAMRLRLRFETGAKRAGQEDPHAVLEVRLGFVESPLFSLLWAAATVRT
jgi:hypothetical protein